MLLFGYQPLVRSRLRSHTEKEAFGRECVWQGVCLAGECVWQAGKVLGGQGEVFGRGGVWQGKCLAGKVFGRESVRRMCGCGFVSTTHQLCLLPLPRFLLDLNFTWRQRTRNLRHLL